LIPPPLTTITLLNGFLPGGKPGVAIGGFEIGGLTIGGRASAKALCVLNKNTLLNMRTAKKEIP
jgi:hypothetical protein